MKYRFIVLKKIVKICGIYCKTIAHEVVKYRFNSYENIMKICWICFSHLCGGFDVVACLVNVVRKNTNWNITSLRRKFHSATTTELRWHRRSLTELKWRNLSSTYSSLHGSLCNRVLAAVLVSRSTRSVKIICYSSGISQVTFATVESNLFSLCVLQYF